MKKKEARVFASTVSEKEQDQTLFKVRLRKERNIFWKNMKNQREKRLRAPKDLKILKIKF